MPRLINEADFGKEVIKAPVPTLVAFFASWCGPCRIIAPVLDELDMEFNDKIRFVKVDVDEAKTTARDYGVRGVPTLVLFKNGEIVDKVVGILPKQDLAAKITPWA
jgi:thioredoxin 1